MSSYQPVYSHPVTQPPRSGLGRGLAALIPTAEPIDQPTLSDDEQILHNLVQSGLDQLAGQINADVLGYLHLPNGSLDDDAVLFMRRPSLDSLPPAGAFRLFLRLQGAAAGDTSEGTFCFDDTNVLFVRTASSTRGWIAFRRSDWRRSPRLCPTACDKPLLRNYFEPIHQRATGRHARREAGCRTRWHAHVGNRYPANRQQLDHRTLGGRRRHRSGQPSSTRRRSIVVGVHRGFRGPTQRQPRGSCHAH